MSNYGNNIPKNGPNRRRIDLRSLSYALDGPVKPYPVYQFSGGRVKLEYDQHNPFFGSVNNILDEQNSPLFDDPRSNQPVISDP